MIVTTTLIKEQISIAPERSLPKQSHTPCTPLIQFLSLEFSFTYSRTSYNGIIHSVCIISCLAMPTVLRALPSLRHNASVSQCHASPKSLQKVRARSVPGALKLRHCKSKAFSKATGLGDILPQEPFWLGMWAVQCADSVPVSVLRAGCQPQLGTPGAQRQGSAQAMHAWSDLREAYRFSSNTSHCLPRDPLRRPAEHVGGKIYYVLWLRVGAQKEIVALCEWTLG